MACSSIKFNKKRTFRTLIENLFCHRSPAKVKILNLTKDGSVDDVCVRKPDFDRMFLVLYCSDGQRDLVVSKVYVPRLVQGNLEGERTLVLSLLHNI